MRDIEIDWDEDGIILLERTDQGNYVLGCVPWEIIAVFIKEHL